MTRRLAAFVSVAAILACAIAVARDGTNPRKECFELDRLHQAPIRPAFHRQGQVLGIGSRGDDKDWDLPVTLIRFEKLEEPIAIQGRQHQIQKDKLRRIASGNLQGGRPIGGGEHLVTVPLQVSPQGIHDL